MLVASLARHLLVTEKKRTPHFQCQIPWPFFSRELLCWVRAASGPFLGEQFISAESGFKMGFCQWAGMGRKVGQKWVFGCKSG